MIKLTKKKSFVAGVCLFLMSIILSVVLDPIRYKVIPLYLFSARQAPLMTKLRCAAITNHEVHEKFENPPDFDKKSLNGLQEFWHYSLFRGCLFEHGYDMEGARVPESLVEGKIYTNPYLGFSFKLSDSAQLVTDNELDVETDDRLYTSVIETDSGTIEVYAYKSYDYVSLDGIFEHGSNLRYVDSDIREKELRENAVTVQYETGEALVFTNGVETVYLYCDSFSDEMKELILSTFQFR